jgi:hypothetical protein
MASNSVPAKVRSLSDHQVVLESNETLEADPVVVGIGVRPSLGFVEQAGIAVDRGIIVDRYLRTSPRGIFAAMIGGNEPFDAVPFFWGAHYDTSVLYVGHAEIWDSLQIDGSVETRHCRIVLRSAGRTLAVATIGLDLDGLHSELELETARPAQ